MIKLSAEKEQQLTAMLATRILKKGATRLGKKEKARFATKVGICVDNVQYRWMCYKRSYLTKVRQFCLLMTFFPQAPSVPIVPAPAEKAAHNISWKNKPSCVTRTKRNGKEVFDHKCDNTSYDGWPTARAALLLSDHKFTGLSQVILVTRGCDNQ